MTIRIGVDVGGTFTDLFVWSTDRGVETFKALSTPRDPSVGVLEGLGLAARARGESLRDFAGNIEVVVHGTTVTTNAVLTRGGARTGLVTTEGVRDALEMRRGIRERQYDNRYENVVPLVPRFLRLPVRGRLDGRGEEIEPLDVAGVRAAAKRLREEGVRAVAICLMNSFAGSSHEAAAKAIVREEMPDAFLSVSSEVLPSIRFYDRVSTTALDAYVGPVLQSYLESLTARLADVGFGGVLLVMQSNGGVALPEVAMARPSTTLLSGPAAAPRAAANAVRPLGRDDCIVVDMGGTSFDAALVRSGSAALRTEGEIERLRIGLPMLDITTIGAGGGSIGWLDEGGLLRMGPGSAGALPGPACYGRGGERPTCTDADLVLGYLDPAFFAGGALRLDVQRAREAIRREIAEPMGLTVEHAAAGMVRTIDSNMAHGVRAITVRRGLDPREFAMVVAGGAGPVHACGVADELEIPVLVVPSTASTLCASGMLLSDLAHDFVRSHIGPLAAVDFARLRALVDQMVAEGSLALRREGVSDDRATHEVALDLRYLKQYHEVTLRVLRESIDRGDIATIAAAFHVEHDRLYGYHLASEGTGLELINVRVRSIGRTDKPPPVRLDPGDADPSGTLRGSRRAWVSEDRGFREVPLYDGHRLRAGNVIEGPAIVERTDTSIVIGAGYVARVDEQGNSVLRRRDTGGASA